MKASVGSLLRRKPASRFRPDLDSRSDPPPLPRKASRRKHKLCRPRTFALKTKTIRRTHATICIAAVQKQEPASHFFRSWPKLRGQSGIRTRDFTASTGIPGRFQRIFYVGRAARITCVAVGKSAGPAERGFSQPEFRCSIRFCIERTREQNYSAKLPPPSLGKGPSARSLSGIRFLRRN